MKNTPFLFALIFLFGAAWVGASELEDVKRDEQLRIELEEVQERSNQERFQQYVTELAAAAQADARNRPPERGIDDSKFYKSYNPLVLFTW
jgi:hypothetical protein